MTRFLQDEQQVAALQRVGELLVDAVSVGEHEFMPQLDIRFPDRESMTAFLAAMDEAVSARRFMPPDGYPREDTPHGIAETLLRYSSMMEEDSVTVSMGFGRDAYNVMNLIQEQIEVVRNERARKP